MPPPLTVAAVPIVVVVTSCGVLENISVFGLCFLNRKILFIVIDWWTSFCGCCVCFNYKQAHTHWWWIDVNRRWGFLFAIFPLHFLLEFSCYTFRLYGGNWNEWLVNVGMFYCVWWDMCYVYLEYLNDNFRLRMIDILWCSFFICLWWEYLFIVREINQLSDKQRSACGAKQFQIYICEMSSSHVWLLGRRRV